MKPTEITEQDATEVVREFLSECPEHIQGAKVLDGRTVLDTVSLVHFTRWSMRKGYSPPVKALAFLGKLRRHCAANGIPFPKGVRE